MRGDDYEPFMLTAEAARYLGYKSRRGLLKAVERGELEPSGMRGKSYVFRRADLEAKLKARARAARLRRETNRDDEEEVLGGPPRGARHLETEEGHVHRAGAARRPDDGAAAEPAPGDLERDAGGGDGGAGGAGGEHGSGGHSADVRAVDSDSRADVDGAAARLGVAPRLADASEPDEADRNDERPFPAAIRQESFHNLSSAK